jgi:hypothetical protein
MVPLRFGASTGVRGWQATSVGERQLGTRPIEERWAMSVHRAVIEQGSGGHQAYMGHISSTKLRTGNECDNTVSECEGPAGA